MSRCAHLRVLRVTSCDGGVVRTSIAAIILRMHWLAEAALLASEDGASNDEEGDDGEAGPRNGGYGGEKAAAKLVPARVLIGPVGLRGCVSKAEQQFKGTTHSRNGRANEPQKPEGEEGAELVGEAPAEASVDAATQAMDAATTVRRTAGEVISGIRVDSPWDGQ